MPKLIITATFDVPEDAMGQAEAFGRIQDEVNELKKAVAEEGGTFESRIIRPKPAKATRAEGGTDAP
jgi:hypothetical protein